MAKCCECSRTAMVHQCRCGRCLYLLVARIYLSDIRRKGNGAHRPGNYGDGKIDTKTYYKKKPFSDERSET